MNENEQESRWVSGDGPINRRTVNRQQLRDTPPADSVSPEAFARAERSQARSALGAGLAQQLEAAQTPAHQAPHALQIVFAIVFTCGVLTGLLAWLQMSLLLGVAALGLVLLGALGWFKGVKRPLPVAASRGGVGARAPLFDKKTLSTFDEVLQTTASELSPAVHAVLRRIKAALAQAAQHAGPVDEHFTQDDRMFLVECLRRYIPDSLDAYLRVPPAQRRQALSPQESSPEDALAQQLMMLQDEIEKRSKKIGRSAAEDLLKQQRFLESKKSR